MLITRYNNINNPFLSASADPFRLFEDTVNQVFNQPSDRPWTPAVDIQETENEVVLKADLPDVNEKEIDIRIEDGTLSLKGERKFNKETKEGGFHRIERSYGSFARYFALPDSVNPEAVRAEYKNGVLTVSLAKKEAAKPKQIKVEVQ